ASPVEKRADDATRRGVIVGRPDGAAHGAAREESPSVIVWCPDPQRHAMAHRAVAHPMSLV
ncbi:MAG: hypothetical protein ACK48C_09340, partial [Roseiflexaceae bacterium]